MTPRLILLLALLMPCVARAEWKHHSVGDHLRGTIGYGVGVTGVVEEHGRRQREAKLSVNCIDNSTTLLAEVGFVTVSGEVAVSYSLDGGPARRQTWSICKGNDCIGLWRGAGIGFAKDLMKARELKMIVHRPHLSDLYATFDVSGAQDAVGPIGRICGWLPRQ